jgi:hypothetical protein
MRGRPEPPRVQQVRHQVVGNAHIRVDGLEHAVTKDGVVAEIGGEAGGGEEDEGECHDARQVQRREMSEPAA